MRTLGQNRKVCAYYQSLLNIKFGIYSRKIKTEHKINHIFLFSMPTRIYRRIVNVTKYLTM